MTGECLSFRRLLILLQMEILRFAQDDRSDCRGGSLRPPEAMEILRFAQDDRRGCRGGPHWPSEALGGSPGVNLLEDHSWSGSIPRERNFSAMTCARLASISARPASISARLA